MIVVIDPRRCNGCERCVNTCFEVFRQWGEFLRPSFEVKDEVFREKVEKAARDCPRKAIVIVD
ncbi:MAG TPA: ferredoxin [Syntrophales bacterium]|nr:ferredoxin [Syntrophales bacterium]HOM07261.1 ferredoxin [Syntrophales bacterium]HON99741.1 ferredoxin [Syntrophales bacterium]HPC01268.1 ferredoxin [Syntrophales bacterium]HPQ06924.1 ferredoxin [Syntrophales bacterium]